MPHPLEVEAKRLHERYMVEFVERLGLCPWANDARERGMVRHHVCLVEPPDMDVLYAACDSWTTDAEVAVGFVVLPLYQGTHQEFSDWVECLRRTRAGDVFAMAPFFARDAEQDDLSLVEFLRQSPDPTVQLLRHSILADVRGSDTPKYVDVAHFDLCSLKNLPPRKEIYEAVYLRNRDKVAESGRTALSAVLESIQADRNGAYAGLV